MDDDRRNKVPKVYVVDDEPTVRDALRLLLHSVGLDVVVFAGAREFLEYRIDEHPGCVVTDLRMPLMSGIDLLEALRARGSALPVVIISGHGDIRLAVRALKSGAVDFVEKPFNEQDLLDAVNAALLSFRRSGGSDAARSDGAQRLESLSLREREVLRLVVSGLPNKTIGRQLGVSTRTVEAHRAHLMEKMQVGSLAELVSLAIRGGIDDIADDEGLGSHRRTDR